ncbi:MAG: DUF6582 domain-containing protein [Chloroflexota bacterium]
MATLDTEDRNELRDSQFAYVDKDGERHLPVHDEDHARNAVSRFGQTDFESREAKRKAAKKVLAAARKHGIDVSDDSDVSKAAKG